MSVKDAAALRRYRVMAVVTGVMLLILVAEMTIKYGFKAGDDVMQWIGWIPFAHGWIYVIYLITVYDLWSRMRWGFNRLWVMVFGGVVPVLSFVVEKRTHGWVHDRPADSAGAAPIIEQ